MSLSKRQEPSTSVGVRRKIERKSKQKAEKAIENFQRDERKIEQKAETSIENFQRAETSLPNLQKEENRLEIMLKYEKEILESERQRLISINCDIIEEKMKDFIIVGLDEVGVGPLAGPCTAGAVVLNLEKGVESFFGLNDSKQMNLKDRISMSENLKKRCLYYSIASCSSKEVDELNPRQASIEAMRRALIKLIKENHLENKRIYLLIDYHSIKNVPNCVIGQLSMAKGDSKSQSIAAASVLAKVWRDEYMFKLSLQFPEFGFEKNVGYGTKIHLEALLKGKICPEHRKSFAPVKNAIALKDKVREEEEDEEEEEEEEEDLDLKNKSLISSKKRSRDSKDKVENSSSLSSSSSKRLRTKKALVERKLPNENLRKSLRIKNFGKRLLSIISFDTN